MISKCDREVGEESRSQWAHATLLGASCDVNCPIIIACVQVPGCAYHYRGWEMADFRDCEGAFRGAAEGFCAKDWPDWQAPDGRSPLTANASENFRPDVDPPS